MLVELRLENYAVIDNVVVEFGSGLNLLTGETGAGKSILIDALSLLLGEKASADIIRVGTERAVVSAVFEADGLQEQAIAKVLESYGLDADNESIILRREIAAGGKGRVFINNQPATVAVLRQLGPHLATVHAQNESLMSFDGATRLSLLDRYGSISTQEVAEAFSKWKAVSDRIAELERDEHDKARLLDLWNFQKKEIEEARLQAGEDERLEAEKRVLANAEKIYNAAMNAFDLLYEGSASTAATLRAAHKHIEELALYEPKFQEAAAALESARISVEDVGATVRDYAGGIQASPEHLAAVEDRLAVLDRVKRKYGPAIRDAIDLGKELASKIRDVEHKDEVLVELRGQLSSATAGYLKTAAALSRKRQEVAARLGKSVESEINELAMKVQFRVEFSGSENERDWTAGGFDRATYLIATNPGEPMRPLEQIASGGEMSRVMLALRTVVEGSGASTGRKKAPQRTMVFDEIDTGIGGRAAEAVGKKLKALARTSQVLCVTHLPQIATFADQHYVIEKKSAGGKTKTTVRQVSGVERTEEVARMLSGAKLTETSRKHAEQLIRSNA